MSDESPNTRRLSSTSAGCLLFGGLVLYALAPGPIGVLAHFIGEEWVDSTFRIVFYPLVLLNDQFPLVARFYEVYTEWFAGLCGLT